MKERENSLVRMSFSIEPELFSGLETLLREHGYSNRSEFIRDMIRKQLTRRWCAGSGEVIGTVSVLCDLSRSGIEADLAALLDRTEKPVVLGATRFAVGGGCSSTMIALRGVGCEIRELVDNIRKFKGVLQAEFVITSPASGGREQQ